MTLLDASGELAVQAQAALAGRLAGFAKRNRSSPARSGREMRPRRYPPSDGSLEVSEDIEFEKRSWYWERVSQTIVMGLVLAALAGLFGGGPLSTARAVSASGSLTVEHPRFTRNQSAYKLVIQVAPTAVQDGTLEVWIDEALARALTINSISPTPEATRLGSDRLYLRFRATPEESLSAITVHATADAIGRERGQVGLAEGEQVDVASFIYP